MAIVCERKVASAALVELLDASDVFTKRVAVFDSHQRDLFSARAYSFHIGGRERQLDLVPRDLAGEALNRIEFFHGGFVGALISGRFERFRILVLSGLADVDAKE